MSEKLFTVKEVSLNNNCPECYSTKGLKLTFKQKYIETKLSKSVTPEISTEMQCDVCSTIIYPVSWTEAIERVYDYQFKAFTPKKSSTKLKKLAWGLMAITLAIILTIGFLLVKNYL